MSPDHIIEFDHPLSKDFGFTEDLFRGYLWRTGNEILISAILSLEPGKGHFSRLVETIQDRGYTVAVPVPMYQMQKILGRWGWVKTIRPHVLMGEVEVWIKPEE